MELIIEEKQENQPRGLYPFKDLKLPPLLRKVDQNGKNGNNQFLKSGNPREPFKQPSYHQKYQQTYKHHSNQPQSQQQQQMQSQTFSYDNILNSLHMKVNGGKLEYIPSNQNSLEKTKNKIINHYFQNQPQQTQQSHQFQSETTQEQINKNQPMTRQQHEKRLAYYYWQQYQQRKRIAQIKSKKMLYPTDHIQISRPSQKYLTFG